MKRNLKRMTEASKNQQISQVMKFNDLQRSAKQSKAELRYVITCKPLLDCEQPLFFFRFSKGSARMRKMRETRVAAQEEKRETVCTARPNEICVGLTVQNTIG